MKQREKDINTDDKRLATVKVDKTQYYLYNGIYLSRERNELLTDKCHNTDEIQKHCAK